jgi:hypothetical protein
MQLPVGDEVTVDGAFLISPYRVLGPFYGRDGDPSFVLHCLVVVTIAGLDILALDTSINEQ